MSARSSSSRPWQGVCAAAPVLGNNTSSWPSLSDSATLSSRPLSGASAAAQGSDGACNLDP